MKSTVLFSICLLITGIAAHAEINQRATAADTSKITISIGLGKTTFLQTDDIPATLMITNHTNAPLAIPAIFNNFNDYAYPSLTDEPGRPISPLVITFADYAQYSGADLITIEPGRSFKIVINVNALLKQKDIALTGGAYQLEACYINNTNAKAVQGRYYSNRINFSLPREAPKVLLTATTGTRTTVVSNVVTFTAKPDSTLVVRPFKPATKSKNETGTFTDSRDGQVYKWVKIGKQVWMAQNLNYKPKTGKYYVVNGDSTNTNKYGLLYEYAQLKDACPEGWHVPSDAEWKELEKNVLSKEDHPEGSKWEADDLSNFLPGGSSGFDVLFTGLWRHNIDDQFGKQTDFWVTKDEESPNYIFRRFFMKDMNKLMRGNQGTAFNISVRCVKNTD